MRRAVLLRYFVRFWLESSCSFVYVAWLWALSAKKTWMKEGVWIISWVVIEVALYGGRVGGRKLSFFGTATKVLSRA